MAAAATRWLCALLLQIQRKRSMAFGESALLRASLTNQETFGQQAKAVAALASFVWRKAHLFSAFVSIRTSTFGCCRA